MTEDTLESHAAAGAREGASPVQRMPAPSAGVRPRSVHEGVAAQARLTPEAVALATRAGQVTYAELDARANRLAAWLRSRGAGPGSFVATLLPRALERGRRLEIGLAARGWNGEMRVLSRRAAVSPSGLILALALEAATAAAGWWWS